MPDLLVGGLSGVGSAITATHRIIFRGASSDFLPGGKIIDGTLSRDPGNTGDINVLRAGLEMGKVSATGRYAPAILGTTNAAYTTGTSLTLTAAAATEISRRIGSSGTFTIVGPPGAAGIVASETVTYSAINTTSGVATVTALVNDYISGSFVQPTDGSQDIKTIIPDGYGVNVFGSDGSTSAHQPFPRVPTAGTIISSNLCNWPSDTSLRSWLISMLSVHGEGKFVFDNLY